MKIAIMQPYFMPYLGYFHLLDAVDIFVVLDDVRYPKNGWVNRNRIVMNGEPAWLTVPVSSEGRHISEKTYSMDERFFVKTAKKLTQLYSASDSLACVLELFGRWRESGDKNVSTVNMMLIQSVCSTIGLRTPTFLRSSQLSLSKGAVAETRVIEICLSLGASQYVNLPGGEALYEHENFARAGLKLSFVRSQFQPYAQRAKTFLPKLSVLDLLLNQTSRDLDWSDFGAYTLSQPFISRDF